MVAFLIFRCKISVTKEPAPKKIGNAPEIQKSWAHQDSGLSPIKERVRGDVSVGGVSGVFLERHGSLRPIRPGFLERRVFAYQVFPLAALEQSMS